MDRKDVAAVCQNRTPFTQATSRRALLGGGLAAAAAAGAYVVVKSPLELWSSLAEVSSEYRTEKGEQRYFPLSQALTVEMNTQTSLSRYAVAGGYGLKLITGEVAITAKLNNRERFQLVASGCRLIASQAQFNVRYEGGKVCVTCTSGTLQVETPQRISQLTSRHQVTYEGRETSPVVAVDPIVVTSWRTGNIILHDVSLGDAVAEINRYRPGRIVVANSELKQQRVNTVLQVSDLRDVVALIRRMTGAHATEVGNFVLLT
jgi:transmembrane sensor